GHQQESAHAGCLPDAERHNVVLDVLHRVVDREACRNGAARRVDVELDVLLRIFTAEEQHLRNDDIGDVVVDRRSQEDDVVPEQTAVDVVGSFATTRLLDHHWYQSHLHSLSCRLGNQTNSIYADSFS